MSTLDRLINVLSAAMNREISADELKDKNIVTVLGLNSVDALEVLIRVEGEFGIQIEDEDLSIELVSSLENLEKYVDERCSRAVG